MKHGKRRRRPDEGDVFRPDEGDVFRPDEGGVFRRRAGPGGRDVHSQRRAFGTWEGRGRDVGGT